jgi:hypothetical protein
VGHESLDLVRDILSALVSGLLLLALSSYLAYRRDTRKKLEAQSHELRDIRQAISRLEGVAGIEPFRYTT